MKDIIVQLRPTAPNRRVEDIDAMVHLLAKNGNKFDSIRAVQVIFFVLKKV